MTSNTLTKEEAERLVQDLFIFWNEFVELSTHNKKKKKEPLSVSVVEEREEVNEI